MLKKNIMKRLFYVFLSAFIMSWLVSCSLDDDTNLTYVDLGVVMGEDVATFKIKTDNNLILIPVEFPDKYEIENGKRVLVQYEIIKSDKEENTSEFRVKALSIQNLLVKEILEVNDIMRDTLADDPLRIVNVWVGQSFLNVEFSFYGYEKAHYFDLVLDPIQQVEDSDEIILDFHHNANNDVDVYELPSIMSFNLKPLQVPEQDSIKILFRANDKFMNGVKINYKY